MSYFPRLFELVDAAVEEGTAAAVGVARAEMHGPLRLGLPTVDLHATFAAPCRLGETLEIAVAHGEVGGASVVLTATVTVAADRKSGVEGKSGSGRVDLGGRRSIKKKKHNSKRRRGDTTDTKI